MSRAESTCDGCGCVLECPICCDVQTETAARDEAVQAERARCVELWTCRTSFTKPHVLAALKGGLTVAELRATLRNGTKP